MPLDARYIARLGLHGLQRLALPILCALILDGSLLLVGRHGSAKTTLVRRLAAALGLSFRVFDATKTPFEDLLGFVDPASLSEGEARYVPTPLSAWGAGFILVDELSRADGTMQSKFLELIFERTLMGLPLTNLRYVAAAMNPSSYYGAGAVDEALVGRFDVILQVPDFNALSHSEQRAAVLAGAEFGPLADQAHALTGFISAARDVLPAIQTEHGDRITRYVLSFARAALAEELALDGRRVVMIVRNLCAALAARAAGWAGEEDEEALFLHVVEASLPFVALDPAFDPLRVRSAHAIGWGSLLTPDALGLELLDVLDDGDADLALRRYLELAGDLDATEHDRVVHRFQEDLRRAPIASRATPAVRLLRLLAAVQQDHADFPPELVARLLAWGHRLLGLERDHEDAYSELSEHLGDLRFDRPEDALAARLALQLALSSPNDPEGVPAIPLAGRHFSALRSALTHSSTGASR